MDFLLTAIIQGLCFSAIALGIYISMKIFNIPDITTDGSYTLGGVVTAVTLNSHVPVLLTLPIVIVAGGIAGAVTGLIHTKLKINALLAGILVMTALHSVNLIIPGRSNVPLTSEHTLYSLISVTGNPNENTLITLIVFIGILTLLIGYLLKTDFGIAMRATGNSELMVKALGVNTDRMKIIGLAIANALTAVGAYLVTQFDGYADISMGIGVVIIGLGSVIIGEALINWFSITSVWISLVSVLFGAMMFRMVLALTLSLGVDANLLSIVTAGFVLLIVGIPRLFMKEA